MPTFLQGGSIIAPPIAFDFSHAQHLMAQTVMWSRGTEAVDGLIRLLREEGLEDGSSLWDRSLIYVATDFGRSKGRPAGSTSFGTGHDQNNDDLFVSTLLKEIASAAASTPTRKTYGFDPADGKPAPDTLMREGHLYSLMAQALDSRFPGRLAMDGLVR